MGEGQRGNVNVNIPVDIDLGMCLIHEVPNILCCCFIRAKKKTIAPES